MAPRTIAPNSDPRIRQLALQIHEKFKGQGYMNRLDGGAVIDDALDESAKDAKSPQEFLRRFADEFKSGTLNGILKSDPYSFWVKTLGKMLLENDAFKDSYIDHFATGRPPEWFDTTRIVR